MIWNRRFAARSDLLLISHLLVKAFKTIFTDFHLFFKPIFMEANYKSESARLSAVMAAQQTVILERGIIISRATVFAEGNELQTCSVTQCDLPGLVVLQDFSAVETLTHRFPPI